MSFVEPLCFWEIVGIIFTLFLCVMIPIVFLVMNKRISFSNKKGSISIGGKGRSISVSEILGLSDELCRLKYLQILNDQMTYAQDALSQIRGDLEDEFLAKLSNGDTTKHKNFAEHADYLYFSSLMWRAEADNVDRLRSTFRVNNLGRSDFENYAMTKVRGLLQHYKDMVKGMYTGEREVTRYDVECLLDSKKETMERMLMKTFENARKVGLDGKKRMHEIQKKLEEIESDSE